jgi:type II secretory pathway predicted ATPase ExeA
MYEKHFGLRRGPFRSTPDCSRYYPSTTHENALNLLRQGLEDQEGLLLMTGEPGLGKTLLCHCLLQHSGEDLRSAFLTNSHVPDRFSLLQSLAYELTLPYEGQLEQVLRLTLTENLLACCAGGHSTLLIVDEAQHLGCDALEELRLLANLESAQGRALQIVLAGHPTILQKLAHPDLGSLRQRLAVRPHLEPLSPTEAADYLLHHLRMTTDHPEKLVSAEALELLARGTHGVPRLLSQATHRALYLACSAGSSTVDAEAALEALFALGLEVEDAVSGIDLNSHEAA